jgi:SAM-dependent methyltransferase
MPTKSRPKSVEKLYDEVGRRYSENKAAAISDYTELPAMLSLAGAVRGRDVLDVGCGPGRHLAALERRGVHAVGIDVSARFVAVAAEDGLCAVRADARALPLAGRSFDGAVSLCQGAFGLLGSDPEGDVAVLREMVRVVRPGGRVAVSAFSSYFAVRFLEDTDDFDPATGVNHERATVKDESGTEAEFDLWTTCFTPRELRLLAAEAGLVIESLWSVSPGSYAARRPDLDHPEWLLVGSTIAR